DAIPPAPLAATTLDVEAESSGVPPAGARVGELGEDRADRVEGLGVGAGVRARRAPDGVLVDGDDLVDCSETLDRVVEPAGAGAPVELAGARREENAVHERALARAAHAGHGGEDPEGEADVDPAQVVLACASDGEPCARRAARRRELDPPVTCEV